MCSWSLDLDPTDPHRPTYSIYSTLDAQLRPLSSVKGSASAWYQEISTNWRLDWSSRSCSGLVDYPGKWNTKQSAGSIFLNKTLPQDSWIQSPAWGKPWVSPCLQFPILTLERLTSPNSPTSTSKKWWKTRLPTTWKVLTFYLAVSDTTNDIDIESIWCFIFNP